MLFRVIEKMVLYTPWKYCIEVNIHLYPCELFESGSAHISEILVSFFAISLSFL